MDNSRISYLWRDAWAAQGFRSAVSLHSHTNHSRETLNSLARFGNQYYFMRPLMSRLERRSEENHALRVNYLASYWTPPLPPKRALDVESEQIAALDLHALVSLTDHDSISAPMLLQTISSAQEIPVSVEWTAPYGEQAFHLGVHNLPPSRAACWMEILSAYTSDPDPARLTDILVALDAEPEVLVVFNHPMWDLYLVGKGRHATLVNEFMQRHGTYLHALELNGLRHWDENRAVHKLSKRWNKALISGGDRHGMEPNANINLTNAASFGEFVHEIRSEKMSNVLFMPQYAEPWKHRMLRSAVDVVGHYPEFPDGFRRWDERVYHPDANGVPRPLSELWPDGTAPFPMTLGIGLVRWMGRGMVSQAFRLAWSKSQRSPITLGECESSDA